VGPNALAHPTKILGGHADPANPVAQGFWGDAVSFSRIRSRPQSHFAVLHALKKHLVAAFFGSLVSIAMSGKMKANPGSCRIWYLLVTYAIQTS